jgi:hypothetical protein
VAKTAKPVIAGRVPNFLRRWVKLHKAIADCTAAKNELTPRVKQFHSGKHIAQHKSGCESSKSVG